LAGEGAGRGSLVPAQARGSVGSLRAARHTGFGGLSTAGGSPQRHTGGPIFPARRAAPKLGLNVRPATRIRWWAGWVRTGGLNFLSAATHFYECSAELCNLLATLTEQRAAEMAADWYGKHRPTDAKVPEANGRTQRRLEILTKLAALARQAKKANRTLILRVEYRKQR
jgi:hypothetical protein